MARVEIALDDVDGVYLTVGQSPLLTVLTNLVEVFGKLEGRLPLAVQKQVRSLSRPMDLLALEPIFNRGRRTVPDPLMPPVVGRATLAEELERIRSAPDLIAEHLAVTYPDIVPSYVRPWLDRPPRAVDRYVRALQQYHDVVIAQIYPDLDERLRRETEILSRAIATGQSRRLLSRLHPNMTLTGDGRLLLATRSPNPYELQRTRTNRVLLTPMVADPRTFSSNVYGPIADSCIRLGYASPNLAVYAEHARPAGTADPLAALVGPTQAQILRHLELAATTTELADDLGLAPSTVSHHLQNLLTADTVHAHRCGRSVYYRLSDRGHDLLRLYGSRP